jgi:hypothetical protein
VAVLTIRGSGPVRSVRAGPKTLAEAVRLAQQGKLPRGTLGGPGFFAGGSGQGNGQGAGGGQGQGSGGRGFGGGLQGQITATGKVSDIAGTAEQTTSSAGTSTVVQYQVRHGP